MLSPAWIVPGPRPAPPMCVVVIAVGLTFREPRCPRSFFLHSVSKESRKLFPAL